MQNEKDLQTGAEAGGNVEQGRSELLPKGMQRRSPDEAVKESDFTAEELAARAPAPTTDPLAAASNETIARIREAQAEEAGAHQTMPAAGRQDISDEELQRRAARRETLTNPAPESSAHGESFGGEVASVAESRRRLLVGQLPDGALDEEALAERNGSLDYAVRDASSARLHAMREMARREAKPSGEAIGGRVRNDGAQGDAIRTAGGSSPARTAGGAGTGAGGVGTPAGDVGGAGGGTGGV